MSYFGFGDSVVQPNKHLTQPTTYNVLTSSEELAISLTITKQHLGLNLDSTDQDDYLTLLIRSAMSFFENYTGRILINTEFQTYFTYINQVYELKRSKLQSLSFFQYADEDSVWVDFDTSYYYLTYEQDYSRIILDLNQTFPTKLDRFQTVSVGFVAGYGDTDSSIPAIVKLGLLQHVGNLYSNRGDCSSGCADSNVPANAMNIYKQYKIFDLYGGSYRGGL